MGRLLWELLVPVSPRSTSSRSTTRLASLLGVLLMEGEGSGPVCSRLLLRRTLLRTVLNDCFRLMTRGCFPTDSQQGLVWVYQINMLPRLESDLSTDSCCPSL